MSFQNLFLFPDYKSGSWAKISYGYNMYIAGKMKMSQSSIENRSETSETVSGQKIYVGIVRKGLN